MVVSTGIGFLQWLPRWKSKHWKHKAQGIDPIRCLVFFAFPANRVRLCPSEKVIRGRRDIISTSPQNGKCLLFLETVSLEEIRFSRGRNYQNKNHMVLWFQRLLIRIWLCSSPKPTCISTGQPKPWYSLGKFTTLVGPWKYRSKADLTGCVRCGSLARNCTWC